MISKAEGLSGTASNVSLPRHRWYDFKEGFAEKLVRAAIESAGTRQPHVLDPFSGGGTTAVTCGRMGVSATAIEINPFAAFASRAKCSPRAENIAKSKAALQRICEEGLPELPSPLEGVSTFTETPSAQKWLFNRSVLRGFHALDKRLSRENGFRSPMRLALLAALMDCCNAKRDGKCLRYKDGWQSAGTDSVMVRERFSARAKIVIQDLAQDRFSAANVNVLEGDCRQVLTKLRAESFDLIVTSPPYLNSFDYSDVYRPELFAGGFIGDNTDLRRLRLQTLRSHVQVAWRAANYCPSPSVGAIYKKLQTCVLWNRRLPDMVRSYFVDMRQVLRECFRLSRKGASAWFVVSTSAYAGMEISVDELLADIAGRVGWQVEEVVCIRKLRSSVQHFGRIKANSSPPLRESIVILSKPKGLQGRG